MKCYIITKWVEPYELLETIKKYYTCQDFTFDGITKDIEKKKFLKMLDNSSNSIGLYMKNVNKFYLFSKDENFDIWNNLEKIFNFKTEDYFEDERPDKLFELVDLGKAEAGIIIP